MDTREQAIYNEVTAFDDPLDRYGVIIEFGEELPPMDQAAKTDDNIVKGCQSTVWLDVQCRDEHIVLQADSNTAISKGIIAMLVRVLDGLSPAEVQQHSLSFIEAIGLHEHLSSQRSNGLHSMIQTLRKKAESYS